MPSESALKAKLGDSETMAVVAESVGENPVSVTGIVATPGTITSSIERVCRDAPNAVRWAGPAMGTVRLGSVLAVGAHLNVQELDGVDPPNCGSVVNLIEHRITPRSKLTVPCKGPVDAHELFLSIIMPVYNEGNTISRAINDVLSASYPCRTELIVVDDGSADDTASQVGALSRDDLIVVRHRRNLGKGAALQTGIRFARGNYMLPFDADLEYSASDIAQMLQPVLNGKAEVVYEYSTVRR